MVKIAIITYSTFGHIDTLAQALKEGVKSAGGDADIFRVPETLSEEELAELNAPEKSEEIPIANEDTLLNYDAFLFGVPAMLGTLPAQWSAFWDKTGALWAKGSLYGKVAGFFTSSSYYGGGQESTIKNCLSYMAHHGIIWVPLGYSNCFAELANVEELHGSSPWGAGTLTGSEADRDPSELELRIARIQGKSFYETALKFFPPPPEEVAAKKEGDEEEQKEEEGQKEKKDQEKPKETKKNAAAATAAAKRTTEAPATTEKNDTGFGGGCCTVM